MRVHFWGTRGSLPCSMNAQALRAKVRKALVAALGHGLDSEQAVDRFVEESLPFPVRETFGGNTSCIQIKGTAEHVLCDAGTGLRDFGSHWMESGGANRPKTSRVFRIFMSHLHWDHIQGFPFFMPAYMPENRIHIYGCHPDLEQAFVRQQEAPYFPVPLGAMRADIRFTTLEPGKEYSIAGLSVKAIQQNHPGESFGYRFEKAGKAIVYSTDSEHKEEADHAGYPFLEFFSQADLLIFDAQYNLMEAMGAKQNWGHSSNLLAVELAVRAGVKRLCLFHHEHTCDDESLIAFLESTKNYLKFHAGSHPLEILLAFDGLEIRL